MRGRPLPIYLVAATTFAGGLSRGFLLPLRAHELGASRLTIGLLAAVMMITAAALSLPAGYLTDLLGRRAIVFWSVMLGLLSQVLAAASPSVWPLFVAQAIGGLGLSAAQTGLFTALTESAPREQMGRAMGWLTFSMQGGFLAGPAVAGLLLSFVNTQVDLALMSGFWAAALPFTAFFPGGRREATWQMGPVRELVRQPGFQAAMIGAVGISMVWGTLQGYLPIFGKEGLGLPGSLIGYMLAIQAGANGLSRIVAGRIVDRMPRQWPLVVTGLVGASVTSVILPHLAGFAIPTVLLALSVPFVAVGYVALSVSFATIGADANRGLVMGFYSTALFAGLGVGPAAFAPAMQVSYVAGFSVCAAVGIAVAVLVPLVRWAPRRRARYLLPPAA